MDGVINLLNHLLNALSGFELGAVVQIELQQFVGNLQGGKYRDFVVAGQTHLLMNRGHFFIDQRDGGQQCRFFIRRAQQGVTAPQNIDV